MARVFQEDDLCLISMCARAVIVSSTSSNLIDIQSNLVDWSVDCRVHKMHLGASTRIVYRYTNELIIL